MMRVALLVLALTAVCNAILPEIVDSGISHILEDNSDQRRAELDRMFVEVEQLPEDPQKKPADDEDASHQRNNESVTLSPQPSNLHPPNDTESDKVTDSESVHTLVDQETNNITTADQFSDLGNNIDHSCTKDEECCGEQLCVWGQCSQNATKGEAGSTCQYQSDCSSDLCCALHKALLFPVCLAKPIERERCLGASNHLVELLSWDMQGQGPRKHCPCAGDLQCQHLGRGSMCLKGEDSSEEDLTDSLYSEIDYIL
ncbi:dickkopf-related protein 3a isoform X2 [Sparus aurata]|uniref:dickkopf-related protein 3a isoform X2 n=1 Tax=Sparus aurata TaxID=8175 RepID=UPI0011C1B6D0|nr:dickkopf-related protein 3-like isoform X2 [Sparus aurata]